MEFTATPAAFMSRAPILHNAPGGHLWPGSLYEIAHVHLPTITPVNLRSARVATVIERTLLTVTIRYPSIKSLVEYFSSDISYVYAYPIPDEIFVMEIDLAARVLLRNVPFKERAEKKQFHAFWLRSNDGHCGVCDQQMLGLRWDSRGLHHHSEPTNTNTTTDHSTSFEVAGVELITEKEGESREKDEEQNDDEDEEEKVDEGEKELEKDEDDGENEEEVGESEEEDEEVVKKETNEAGVKRKRNKSAEKSLREMMKELKSKKKKGENEVEEDEDDGENEEAVKKVGESEEEDEEVVKKELKEEILELKNYAKHAKKKQSELEEEVRKLRSEMKEIKSKKKKGESQTIGVSSNPLGDQGLSLIASYSAFLILDPDEAQENKVSQANIGKELRKKLLSKLQSELQERSKPNPLLTPYPLWV